MTNIQSTLISSPDFVGAAVTWEPNALDGDDAAFAGRAPVYDATGRHMPYWTRKDGGAFHDEDPILFDPAPGANDWYDIPRKRPARSTSPSLTSTPLKARMC